MSAPTPKVPKALLVVAVRPNFIKVKPVLDALEAVGVECQLVHTGQHYDESLSGIFFQDLGMRRPDISLNTGSGSYAEQIAHVCIAFERVVEDSKPDVVVVVGDVNSTMSCALIGARAGALVVHVEAGLRSRDWSMPEELNRVVADRVSDLLLATSEDAAANLYAEGYRSDQIHVVGNMMIDSLKRNLEKAQQRTIVEELELERGKFGLVTLHRPSNVDSVSQLTELMGTLQEAAEIVPLLMPMHPRTQAMLHADPTLRQLLDNSSKNFKLTEPQGYLDFLCLQSAAAVVLTDSGGIQEETTALGIPCLTLRDNTERPITITCGTNKLVGTDRKTVLRALQSVIDNGVPKRCPALWDGKAGERCADIIVNRLKQGPGLRPTDLATSRAE